MTTDGDQCRNCNRTIGRLEQPFLWHDEVVCSECYSRLSRYAQSSEVGTSSPFSKDVNMQAALLPRIAWTAPGNPFATTVGLLLLIGGLSVAAYFFFAYDTTVFAPSTYIPGVGPFGGGRVHNIGLQQNRQLGCLAGMIAAAAGAVMIALHARKSSCALIPEQTNVVQPSRQPEPSSQMRAHSPVPNPCRPGTGKYIVCEAALKGITIEQVQLDLEASSPGTGCRWRDYVSDVRSENGIDIRIEDGHLTCAGHLPGVAGPDTIILLSEGEVSP